MSYKPSLKAIINARKVCLSGTLFVLATALKWHEVAVTAAVLLYLWIFFGLRNKHKMLRTVAESVLERVLVDNGLTVKKRVTVPDVL
jgi:hypothetical protein